MSRPGEKRNVLITGAAQGLGHATALRLASDGYRIFVNDIVDDGRLSELAQNIGGVAVPGDIANPDVSAAIAQSVGDRDGGLYGVVANAAAMAMAPFLDQPESEWWRQIDVNLSGHFFLIQRAAVLMKEHGVGRIVIIASGWGVIGHPNATAYAASKAGLIALAKGLGRELGQYGIVTNAVAPAYIDTEQLQVDADDLGVSLGEMRERYRSLIPTHHLPSPFEVAATIAYLLGPYAGATIGQILQPTGGVTRTRA